VEAVEAAEEGAGASSTCPSSAQVSQPEHRNAGCCLPMEASWAKPVASEAGAAPPSAAPVTALAAAAPLSTRLDAAVAAGAAAQEAWAVGEPFQGCSGNCTSKELQVGTVPRQAHRRIPRDSLPRAAVASLPPPGRLSLQQARWHRLPGRGSLRPQLAARRHRGGARRGRSNVPRVLSTAWANRSNKAARGEHAARRRGRAERLLCSQHRSRAATHFVWENPQRTALCVRSAAKR